MTSRAPQMQSWRDHILFAADGRRGFIPSWCLPFGSDLIST
jgi:hypothetical protein